jgi:hypothetical protein
MGLGNIGTESPYIQENSLSSRESAVTFLHKSTTPSLLDELRLVDNRYIGLICSHFPILYREV